MLASLRVSLVLVFTATPVFAAPDDATTSDVQWVWSPAFEKEQAPAGVCFFRKTFTVAQPVEAAFVYAAADNRYELVVNGQPVGGGADWRKMDTFDISKHLRVGKNVIGVRAENTEPGPAGLVARVVVRERGGATVAYSTDDSWRVSVKQYRGWDRAAFDDADWIAARSYGQLGTVLPWGNEVVVAAEGARFTLDPEFTISRVARDELTGSAIAMTFAADGSMFVSQERGGVFRLTDKDGDGYFETKTTFTDKINSAQGLLSYDNNTLFAVGPGPEGLGLYRLVDQNSDGAADQVAKLLSFRGSFGEHGPHAVRMGPDNKLYVIVGNFARLDAPDNPRSPYRHGYEGDAVTPRYEDPRGHAVGVPAPGGTVVRLDTQTGSIDIFAAGLRNAYDFAFNSDGELFTYDADMEWDAGLPWYRPTRINHVPSGAELGWRSGWAKWPEYYFDSLPATLNMGAGSPTGVEFYDHYAFPARYQNCLFVADWARGTVHAVGLKRNGAGYSSESKVLVKGRPMAATDLEVGPDGALYICTGGRGTEGAVYRVAWKGDPPAEATNLGQGIDRALRQPKPRSDWGRKAIAAVRQQLGGRWGSELTRAALDPARPAPQRVRAVELMTLHGPAPSEDLLAKLAGDKSPEVRMATARRLSATAGSNSANILYSLLADPDAGVRRVACERLATAEGVIATTSLARLLADEDRFVRFAARRVLENTDPAAWRDAILGAGSPAIAVNGSLALLNAAPSPETGRAVLGLCERLLDAQLPERDFRDLLRLTQLAVNTAEAKPDSVPQLRAKLAAEYPTADATMNRELVRLLVRLQAPEAAAAMSRELESAELVDQLHIGAYASLLRTGWSTPEKLALLRFYESIRAMEGGYSAPAYVEQFARNFFTNLTLPEQRQVLASGERFPTSALSILAGMTENPGPETLTLLQQLDGRLIALTAESPSDAYARLQVGIVAVLARSNDADAVAYLHNVYEKQPERRSPVAMALTQHPEGANWPILVDALATLEGEPAREVLAALGRVRIRPREAKPYRNVILQGLNPSGAGPEHANRLLTFWMGQPEGIAAAGDDAAKVQAWREWYAATYPNERPAELPKSSVPNRWSYEELLAYLNTNEGRAGDANRGKAVFDRATCVKCHSHSGRGERIGPELSTLARRFQTKEVLESIVYPSHVISDQYASKAVVADGKTYVGLAVTNGPNEVIVLTTAGDRVVLDRSAVEAVSASPTSAMPEGLLNPLSLDDIGDLFAFLMTDPGEATARQASPQGGRR